MNNVNRPHRRNLRPSNIMKLGRVSPSGTKLKSLPSFANWGSYIGAWLTVGIIASACYNYGFYQGVGVPIYGSALTVGDLTKDIIIWSPLLSVLMMTTSLMVTLLNDFLKNESKAASKKGRTIGTGHYLVIIIGVFLITATVVAGVVASVMLNLYGILYISLIFIGTSLMNAFIPMLAKKHGIRLDGMIPLFIASATFISANCYAFGLTNATYSLQKKSDDVVILKDAILKNVTILATHENGVLVSTGHHVVLIRWDEIKYFNYGIADWESCAKNRGLKADYECAHAKK